MVICFCERRRTQGGAEAAWRRARDEWGLLDHAPTAWAARAKWGMLAGAPVQLTMVLRDVRLYGFRFAE